MKFGTIANDNSTVTVFFTCALACSILQNELAVFAQSTSATPSPSNVPRSSPSPSPQPFRVGKLFYISNLGLMEKVLRTETDFLQSTNTLQRYLRSVERGITTMLKSKEAPPASSKLQPCNEDGKGKVGPMSNHLEIRGLPLPNTSCYTVFEGVYNPPDNTEKYLSEEDVYNAIIKRANSMFKNKQKIADVVLGNWSETDVNINYLYNTTNVQCMINHVGGLRIGPDWYIFTTVTNVPRRRSVPLFERQWLNGYIHVFDDLKNSTQLRFSVHKRPVPPNTKHELQNDTTESLMSSRGLGFPFSFVPLHIETIPALHSAMDKSDLSRQQADDALAPSSLSILLLPLVLNLIPFAFLTDPFALTPSVSLIYAIMTDVATTLPLGIKGVSLIYIGKEKHRSVVLRMTSAVDGSLSKSAAVEFWGAECKARSSVLSNGIFFLVFAIFFMLLGIALEFMARSWILRRRTLRDIKHNVFQRPTSLETQLLENVIDDRYSSDEKVEQTVKEDSIKEDSISESTLSHGIKIDSTGIKENNS